MEESLSDLLGEILEKVSYYKQPYIKISEDGLEAFVFLARQEDEGDFVYKKEDIEELMAENNIKQGIMEDVIEEIIEKQIYNQEVCIAKGKNASDGTDGYYQFNFDINNSRTPLERENGSVDYYSIYKFDFVEEDQIVAEYFPATNGVYGVTVTGTIIKPVLGRDLPKLKGKGFYFEENKYKASFKGMIELRNNELLYIDSIFEIKGDVDYSTGNIDFDGDVIIRGDVKTGFSVKATGNILVDGNVEASEIISYRDIVLRKGMLGGEAGIVKAGGSILGKFFENAFVLSNEDIFADYFLNCNIQTNGFILANGNEHGGIIGGSARALLGVDSKRIGNNAEIRTLINVGTDSKLIKYHNELSMHIVEKTREIDNLDKQIKKYQQNIDQIDNYKNLKMQRKETERKREEMLEKLYTLKKHMIEANNAAIGVSGTIYAGVVVEINGKTRVIKEQMRRILIKVEEGEMKFLKYYQRSKLNSRKNKECRNAED